MREQMARSSRAPAEAQVSKRAGGTDADGPGKGGEGKAQGGAQHEFKPTSVLVGELGKTLPWEVVKAEEERKRREVRAVLPHHSIPPLKPRRDPVLAWGRPVSEKALVLNTVRLSRAGGRGQRPQRGGSSGQAS